MKRRNIDDCEPSDQTDLVVIDSTSSSNSEEEFSSSEDGSDGSDAFEDDGSEDDESEEESDEDEEDGSEEDEVSDEEDGSDVFEEESDEDIETTADEDLDTKGLRAALACSRAEVRRLRARLKTLEGPIGDLAKCKARIRARTRPVLFSEEMHTAERLTIPCGNNGETPGRLMTHSLDVHSGRGWSGKRACLNR